MSHVFISYKREDEIRVGRIVGALEKAGLEVWWDRGLPGGESWRENIHKQLEAAGCVVVVWSEASVGPAGNWVREEASAGLARHILVPVKIERVHGYPLGFGEVQAIDLTRWKGDTRDPFFRDLVEAVQAKLDGVPPPPPKGPRARVARRLAYGAVSSTGMALLSAVAINAFGVTSKMCTIPGPQPALADACGDLHIGGQPTRVQRTAWAALPKGDCKAMAVFLKGDPGPYAQRASQLLQAGDANAVWGPGTTTLPMHIYPTETDPAPDQARALAAAIKVGTEQADMQCQALSVSGTLFRNLKGGVADYVQTCSPSPSGVTCELVGHIACTGQKLTPYCG